MKQESQRYPHDEINNAPYRMLEEEGVPHYQIPPGIYKGRDEMKAAETLIGFIPQPQDYRWQIVFHYIDRQCFNTKTEHMYRYTALNFENAQLATYLSERNSQRNRYGRIDSDENARHIIRALHNVSQIKVVSDAYNSSDDDFHRDISNAWTPKGFILLHKRTHSVAKNKDTSPLPSCPEVLYQIQSYDEEHGYLCRIGYNIHREREKPIISITNIQGSRNVETSFYNDFRRKNHNIALPNLLIRRLTYMAQYIDPKCEIRGLANPRPKTLEHEQKRLAELSTMYQAVFQAENIPIYTNLWHSGQNEKFTPPEQLS